MSCQPWHGGVCSRSITWPIAWKKQVAAATCAGLRSVTHLAMKALPLLEATNGTIIVVSSMGGKMGQCAGVHLMHAAASEAAISLSVCLPGHLLPSNAETCACVHHCLTSVCCSCTRACTPVRLLHRSIRAQGLPFTGPYAASKHALHGFFDGLRMDLGRKLSRVSIVMAVLGAIDTERSEPRAASAMALHRRGSCPLRWACWAIIFNVPFFWLSFLSDCFQRPNRNKGQAAVAYRPAPTDGGASLRSQAALSRGRRVFAPCRRAQLCKIRPARLFRCCHCHSALFCPAALGG